MAEKRAYKEDLLKSIGENIRTRRIGLNMSQKEFAFACEIEPSSLNRIESGKINITAYTLIRICDALHIEPGQLFR